MNTLPEISIIIPTLNQGSFIEETIFSIINQNYPKLQLIIIDGGSQDKTLEVIKKYEKHIDYWESKPDSGQSEAINKGLAKCTGDVINWINSDDKLEQNALHNIAEIYNKFPQANLFIGKTIYFNHNGEIRKSGRIIFSSPEKTIGFGQMDQPAMFYKKIIFEEIGRINEQLHYCMDLDLWLRYLLAYSTEKIILTDSIWAHFRFHDSSKTIINNDQFEVEKELIYKFIFNNNGLKYSILNTTDELRNIQHSDYPKNKLLNMKLCRNYHYLWRSDELSLMKRKKDAFVFWGRVNPFQKGFSEKRRYLAVIKKIIF